MKGIVFTEFLEMVEQTHSYDLVDELLNENELPSGGAYTSIGTYEHQEMVTLVVSLSKKTKTPVPDLLNAFGQYLFGTFEKGYPAFFKAAPNAFAFLESIENHIHVEVKKLYPDAQLPRFKTNRVANNTLEMIYYSDRSMADFALGLIEKTFDHYKESVSIEREDLVENGSEVKFTLTKCS